MKKLTKAQRARLDKLATYLEGLPEDYKHFSMAWYFRGAAGWEAIRYGRENGGVATCGAVACAVGHGPAAGVLVPPRFLCDFNVDWNGYAALFVGDCGEKPYKWAFDADWADYDNSPSGAAARIRYLLDHGSPPRAMTIDEYGDIENPEDLVALYAPYRFAKPLSGQSAKDGGTR